MLSVGTKVGIFVGAVVLGDAVLGLFVVGLLVVGNDGVCVLGLRLGIAVGMATAMSHRENISHAKTRFILYAMKRRRPKRWIQAYCLPFGC